MTRTSQLEINMSEEAKVEVKVKPEVKVKEPRPATFAECLAQLNKTRKAEIKRKQEEAKILTEAKRVVANRNKV